MANSRGLLVRMSDVGDGTTMSLGLPILQDDFADHARSVLEDQPDLFARLMSLKGEVNAFAARSIPGFAPPSAVALNARNQHLLDQAAILLGRERFEQVFGFPPDEPIELVEPDR